jgi:hypothetical protein
MLIPITADSDNLSLIPLPKHKLIKVQDHYLINKICLKNIKEILHNQMINYMKKINHMINQM